MSKDEEKGAVVAQAEEKPFSLDLPIIEYITHPTLRKDVMATAHDSLKSHSEAFITYAIRAFKKSKSLAEADKVSIGIALRKAARYGLLPDGVQGALVPVNKKCEFWVMVNGLEYMATSRNILETIDVGIIYSRENYSIERGSSPCVKHTPIFEKDKRGDPIIYYAIANSKKFGQKIHSMGIDEVMDSMHNSSAYKYAEKNKKDSAWHTHFEAMAKKTVKGKLLDSISDGLGDSPQDFIEAQGNYSSSDNDDIIEVQAEDVSVGGDSGDSQDADGSVDALGDFLGGGSDSAVGGSGGADLGDSNVSDAVEVAEPAIIGSKLGDITHSHNWKEGQGLVHFKLRLDKIEGAVAHLFLTDKDGNEKPIQGIVGGKITINLSFEYKVAILEDDFIEFENQVVLRIGESVGYST